MRLLFTIAILSLFSFSSGAKGVISAPGNNDLYFVENKGQITDQYGVPRKDIQYALHTAGLDVFIGNGAIHYQFVKTDKAPLDCKSMILSSENQPASKVETYRMDMQLIGSNTEANVSMELNAASISYRIASTGEMVSAKTANKILYKNVYPGIDWAIYIKDGTLEYDFIVADGAKVNAIKQQYFGATTINMPKEGGMEVITPFGSIHEQTPVAYLENGDKVESRFHLAGKTVSFKLADYKGKVTIDPVIKWATYYGGTDMERMGDIANDGSSNVYICGYTLSTGSIATTGSYQQTLSGMIDAYVAKFNASGMLQWATYYGGTADDYLMSITCDNSGNVFACGLTESSGINTTGAHQTVMYGNSDGFLMKMSSTGGLLFCTYYGGYVNDQANDVKCDANDNVFICGSTTSGNFIATTGTHQAFQFGGSQAFLVKFNNAGVRQWGTYFGGTTNEYGSSIDIDAAGYIYLCGTSESSDYVATTGTFQQVHMGGVQDGFLAKFRNNNGQLSWGTYCGDGGHDQTTKVACGPGTEVYLSGLTDGTTALSTTGAYQVSNNGLNDGFLEKFDSTGVRQWGTYFGGNQMDQANAVSCDDSGHVWMAGTANSTANIATTGSYQSTFGGGACDAFLAEFSETGALLWASYYGGPGADYGFSVIDDGAAVYFGGLTRSVTGIATTGAYQTAYGGLDDGFLVKFKRCAPPELTALSTLNFCAGDSVTLTGPVDVGFTYQWMLNGSNIPGATDTTYTALIPGSYTLEVDDPNCSIDTSAALTVTVYALPVPTITVAGNTLSTGTFTTYQWFLNGTAISGATSQTYNFTQQGTYTVVVTNSNGCSDTSANFPVSVGMPERSQNVVVYPNPNNGSFVVKGTIAESKDVTMHISDITGRDVLKENYPVNNGELNAIIKLRSELPAGVYIIKLQSGGKVTTLPFTKQ